MGKSRKAAANATAKPAEPVSQGALWGQESIVAPEKVYTVTEDSYELIEQQPRKGHHIHYRVLFVGSGLLDQKDKVLKRITEAVAHLGLTENSKRVFVVGADLTSVDGAALKTYLNRVSDSGSKVDLVVYLFDSHTDDDPLQDLLVLEDHLPDAPTWPLLTHASEQQQHALSRHLAAYPHVRTVNLTGIHPEMPRFTSSKNTPQHDRALTADQFHELRSEDIARILKGWPTDTAYEPGKDGMIVLPSAPMTPRSIKRTAAITSIMVTAIMAAAWKFGLQSQSPVSIVPRQQVLPTVQAELDPTWQTINEHTLQHPFEVRVDRGDNEDLAVMIQANGVDLEYQMVYEQGSEFKYTADVPSPCLFDSEADLEATVIWRCDKDADTKVEKVIDRVLLCADICKPIQEQRLREEKRRSAVVPVSSLPLDITWQLFIDTLISRTHRVAHTFAAAWQTLVSIWQRS